MSPTLNGSSVIKQMQRWDQNKQKCVADLKYALLIAILARLLMQLKTDHEIVYDQKRLLEWG